jgi:broad specificity phosphatase PhoE
MLSSHHRGKSLTTRPKENGRTTTVLLIRHALTSAVGRYLAGRTDIPLSSEGRDQLRELCMYLRDTRIHAIYSSPLERTLATARALASERDVRVDIRDDLLEVDFGEWTGQSFESLDRLPGWRTYNSSRSTAEVPGGENAMALKRRIARVLADIRDCHPGQTAAIVSHAEIIRSAVLHSLGLSPDRFHQVDIAPASVTTLALRDDGVEVLTVNEVANSFEARR